VRCPFCRHEDTQVVDSRVSEDGAAIRRRRRCPECDKRFTTYERIELALPAVVKKDGSRVEFDRRKLNSSMQLALRKRPVNAEAVDDAIARIEYQLLSSGEREIRSEKLGELVMGELRRLDKIAYVRFASVYRSFEDVSEFQEVILEMRRLNVAKTNVTKTPRKR
jgi:transcriptional repressor NrdR